MKIYLLFIMLAFSAIIYASAGDSDNTPAPITPTGTITMTQAHQDSVIATTIAGVVKTFVPAQYAAYVGLALMLVLVIIGLLAHNKIAAIHKKVTASVIILFFMLSLSSCKTTAVTLVNDMEKYVETHCPKTTVTGPTGAPVVKYDCEGLWNLSNPYCSQATMCVDFLHGSITGTLACQDTSLVKALGTLKPLK